jgi:hypothetical protein
MMFFELILLLIYYISLMEIKSLRIVKQITPKTEFSFDKNFNLPEGPIYAKGWFKYSKSGKDEQNSEIIFFKNPAFYEQFNNNTALDISLVDKVGFVNIPDENHFFLILSEGGVNIISSRKVTFK